MIDSYVHENIFTSYVSVMLVHMLVHLIAKWVTASPSQQKIARTPMHLPPLIGH